MDFKKFSCRFCNKLTLINSVFARIRYRCYKRKIQKKVKLLTTKHNNDITYNKKIGIS